MAAGIGTAACGPGALVAQHAHRSLAVGHRPWHVLEVADVEALLGASARGLVPAEVALVAVEIHKLFRSGGRDRRAGPGRAGAA